MQAHLFNSHWTYFIGENSSLNDYVTTRSLKSNKANEQFMYMTYVESFRLVKLLLNKNIIRNLNTSYFEEEMIKVMLIDIK